MEGPLRNVDLRGLSPEGLRNVLNAAGMMQKFKAQEVARLQNVQLAREKMTSAANKQQIDNRFKAEKLAYDRGKISYSPVRKVNGRQIRDTLDDRGIIVEKNVDLGPVEVKPEKVETIAQKRKLGLDLAKIDGWLSSPTADIETLKGYKDFFNTNTKGDYKWVVQPGEAPKKVPSWVPIIGGRDIPGTKTDTKLERVPIGVGPIESVSQGGAPQGALNYLMANPGAANQFKTKYGYLPEGF